MTLTMTMTLTVLTIHLYLMYCIIIYCSYERQYFSWFYFWLYDKSFVLTRFYSHFIDYMGTKLGVVTFHRYDIWPTQFQIKFVVAGGDFLFYWNSNIVKIIMRGRGNNWNVFVVLGLFFQKPKLELYWNLLT